MANSSNNSASLLDLARSVQEGFVNIKLKLDLFVQLVA